MPRSPFDFVNSINSNRNIMTDPTAEKEYSPFMVNRAMSYFPDTIFIANEINKHHSLPKRLQYEYLINRISPRKRFAKWAKKPKADDDVKLIMEHYHYNEQRAREAVSILSQEQLDLIREQNKGDQ